jgi:heme/copper-type cytochrome/quinol oxidase subunit 4
MCFSAEASFGASAVIIAIGVISIRKSTSIPQKVLSCIPIIFGIQQFSEGIVWLTLAHAGLSPWDRVATYTFLTFAQVVWPIFLPFAVYLLEKDEGKKKVMAVLLALGIIVSSVLGYSLLLYNVQSSISCYHIRYDVVYPDYLKHLGIFYFLSTVVPSVISSTKKLRLLGIIIFIAYIVTRMFYQEYLISVWCFFAAIISAVVLSVILQLNQPQQNRGILPT